MQCSLTAESVYYDAVATASFSHSVIERPLNFWSSTPKRFSISVRLSPVSVHSHTAHSKVRAHFPAHKHVNVDITKLSGRRAGHSHPRDTALGLFGTSRFHRRAVLSLWNGAERVFDAVDLEDDESDLLSSVALRVKVGNGYPLFRRFVVDKDPADVSGISLNGSHSILVKGKRRGPMRTGRAAYSANCASVFCVEVLGQQVPHTFRNTVSCDGWMRMKKSLELSVDTLWAYNHTVQLVVA